MFGLTLEERPALEPTSDFRRHKFKDDTWHWTAETQHEELVRNAPSKVVEMIRALRNFLGRNDVMAYLTIMCIRLFVCIEFRRKLTPFITTVTLP